MARSGGTGPPESAPRWRRAGPEAGQAAPAGGAGGGSGYSPAGAPWAGTEPFMVMVGLSSGRAGTADRSYPHAPQKRSPDSSGSSQLGQADSWGICDINYTHVRGR